MYHQGLMVGRDSYDLFIESSLPSSGSQWDPISGKNMSGSQ